MIKTFPACMELEGLVLYLQKLSIGLYLETVEFSPCIHVI